MPDLAPSATLPVEKADATPTGSTAVASIAAAPNTAVASPLPVPDVMPEANAPPPPAVDPRWASLERIPDTHPQQYTPFIDTVFADFVIPADARSYDRERALSALGPAQLALARNEEFAKAGYIFPDPAWQAWFAAKPWYKPDPRVRPTDLRYDGKRFVEAIEQRETAGPVIEAGGNVFAADLDMDGRVDLIQFEVTEPFRTFRLHVNETSIDGSGDNLTGYAAALDLDPRDRQREAMVTSEGPSGDPSFQLFVYADHQLAAADVVTGTITRIAGDGTFTVVQRAGLLQTWWLEAPYKIDGGTTIAPVPVREYVTISTNEVTARQPVRLVGDPEGAEIVASLQKGEIVDLIATDNKRWVKARTERGEAGWFEVVGYTQVILDGARVPVDLVFDGLSVAD